MKTPTLVLATLVVLSIGATVRATISSTAHRPSVTYPSVTYGSRCGPAGTGTTWVSGTGGATTGVESLTIEQTEVSDNVWLPSAKPIYYTEAEEGCRFTCAENYAWDNLLQECKPTVAVAGMPCNGAPDITIGSYTIQACNVGATVVGTGGATSSPSAGTHFQWGNNYSWWLASLTDTQVLANSSSMAVADTSAYGPSNPYNSGTWIKVAKWSDSFTTNVNDAVNNLWGGAGDRYTANWAGTATDRQGPCPDGYHIPSALEWRGLINTWATSYGMTCNPPAGKNCMWSTLTTGSMDTTEKVFAQFQSDFMLPRAGYRDYSDATVAYPDSYGRYWLSSPYANDTNAYSLYFTSLLVHPLHYSSRGNGISLRCFQNSQ